MHAVPPGGDQQGQHRPRQRHQGVESECRQHLGAPPRRERPDVVEGPLQLVLHHPGGHHHEAERDQCQRGGPGRDVEGALGGDRRVEEPVHQDHPGAHCSLDHHDHRGPRAQPPPVVPEHGAEAAQPVREAGAQLAARPKGFGPPRRGDHAGHGRRPSDHRASAAAPTAQTPITTYAVGTAGSADVVSAARTTTAMWRKGNHQLRSASQPGICWIG